MNGWKYKRFADEAALYAFARCEQFVRDYAESSQIPTSELIQRVADLFFRQAGGAQLGAEDHLPALRGKATRNGTSVAAVAVARRTRGSGPPLKPHWTQRPEKRKQMMKNIAAMLANNPNSRQQRLQKMNKAAQREHQIKLAERRARDAERKRRQRAEVEA